MIKLEDIPIGSGNSSLNCDGETRRWVRLPHPPPTSRYPSGLRRTSPPKTMRALKRTEMKRLYETLPPQKCEVMFLLAGVEKPANVGSIFRIAESINAKVLLCGHTPTPPSPEIEITSMGQENRVDWKHFVQTYDGVKYAKEQGYKVVAIEICQDAKPYHTYDYPKKVCLVLGHENSGIHQEILSICDDAVFIPYFGKNYSLNVAVSAAIVAFRAVL